MKDHIAADAQEEEQEDKQDGEPKTDSFLFELRYRESSELHLSEGNSAG